MLDVWRLRLMKCCESKGNIVVGVYLIGGLGWGWWVGDFWEIWFLDIIWLIKIKNVENIKLWIILRIVVCILKV